MNEFSIENIIGYKEPYDYLDDVLEHTLEKLKVKKATFSILFIDDEEMERLNTLYRGIEKTTDVLSFALEDGLAIQSEVRELGDIYVSIPKMKEQAIAYNHSEKRELSFLCVHGLLHLLGYDHTRNVEEEKIQFGLQEEILNDLGIIN